MKPLLKEDLIPYAEYELQREEFRRRIIALKKRRRISLGKHVTMLFENRETVQFQIQEMVRVERIVDPVKVQDELDVYNGLLPAEGELSATLFIEVTESDRVKEELDSFKGIDHGQKVALNAGGYRVYGTFEGGHSHDEKISAVHFVTFRPTTEFVHALVTPGSPVSISVRHGSYEVDVPVPPDMRQEWLADLAPEKVATVVPWQPSGSG